MVKNKKIELISAEVSACRLVKQSSIVISMPFTSTAILAGQLGKPTCYYDPTGLVQKNDRAAHGIPIVSGIEELKTWFIQAQKTLNH